MQDTDVRSLKARLKKNPEDTGILLSLVGALRAGGRYDQAISHIERYLAAHPDEFDVLIAYGDVLADLQVGIWLDRQRDRHGKERTVA